MQKKPSGDGLLFKFSQVRQVLDVLDEVSRGLHSESDIVLPKIVVVGDQSSGKSSVLESLSGVNMPRGQGCVTRCPLVLRMVNITEQESKHAMISSEKHPAERIDNLDHIGPRIEQLTKDIAGAQAGRGISPSPIRLTVYTSGSPDLTLVDLPGITRNPVGDQPHDIYEQIRDMIYTYIRPEETIILNVLPADWDFATSESMRMSREVDPKGERTIGVVTKIDRAEQGIFTKLMGGPHGKGGLALRLGYVAVRNRTPQELSQGVALNEVLKREDKEFAVHKELKRLPADMKGTPALAKKLARIQLDRIRHTLPGTAHKIQKLLKETQDLLSTFPQACRNERECQFKLTELILSVDSRLKSLIQSQNKASQGNVQLHIPARLQDMFHKFGDAVAEKASPFLSEEYAERITRDQSETSGYGLVTFISNPVFQSLVEEELEKVVQPAFALVRSCAGYLNTVMESLCSQTFSKLPNLSARVKHIVLNMMETMESTSMQRVEEALKKHSFVFTLNPYYSDCVSKLRAAAQETGRRSSSRVEINDLSVDVSFLQGSSWGDVQEIQLHMFCYWVVVRRLLVDEMCQEIRFRFMIGLREQFALTLNNCIPPAELMQLMAEPPAVATERKRVEDRERHLREALGELSKLKDNPVFTGAVDISGDVPRSLGERVSGFLGSALSATPYLWSGTTSPTREVHAANPTQSPPPPPTSSPPLSLSPSSHSHAPATYPYASSAPQR